MVETKPYSEKKSRFPYIGNSAEEFLSQTYGKNNWRYDHNLYIKSPERGGPSSVIPIETGAKIAAVSTAYTDLTIYAEEIIPVVEPGHKLRYVADDFKKIHHETRVFEIAKFKFYEDTYPYVETRLNLSGVAIARLFCVFTSNKLDSIRVVRQPKPISTGDTPCTYVVYEKIS